MEHVDDLDGTFTRDTMSWTSFCFFHWSCLSRSLVVFLGVVVIVIVIVTVVVAHSMKSLSPCSMALKDIQCGL